MIDSEFYFESIQRNGSFRDIVRCINKELAIEEEEEQELRKKIK
jgi:hypothetical protein